MKNKKNSFENPPHARLFSDKPSPDKPVATYSPSGNKPVDNTPPSEVSTTFLKTLRTQRREIKSRRTQIVLTPTFFAELTAISKQLDVSFNELAHIAFRLLINSLKQ